MNTFTLCLQSASQYESISDVVSFTGEDASGQFGILALHARMMTCLKYGLMKFQYSNDKTEYLALPGGILYFLDNQLYICTRHYLRNKDYQTILTSMEKELRQEEENLQIIKESLRHLDEEMIKRLVELKRYGT